MKLEHVRLKRVGNSLGIILPRRIVKSMCVRQGDELWVEIVKAERINAFGILAKDESAKKIIDEIRHQAER